MCKSEKYYQSQIQKLMDHIDSIEKEHEIITQNYEKVIKYYKNELEWFKD